MKWVGYVPEKEWLNFGSDPKHILDYASWM